MSLLSFYDGLQQRLAEDQYLTAWAKKHFRCALTTIEGNRRLSVIRPEILPAIVFELDDSELGSILPGATLQEATPEISFSVVWHEQDPSCAFRQRLELFELPVRALLSDCSLGGRTTGAKVVRIQPDLAGNHPTHIVTYTATCDDEIFQPED